MSAGGLGLGLGPGLGVRVGVRVRVGLPDGAPLFNRLSGWQRENASDCKLWPYR